MRTTGSATFRQRSIDALVPFMRGKAHELVDGFARTGTCEFMAEFADPWSPALVTTEADGRVSCCDHGHPAPRRHGERSRDVAAPMGITGPITLPLRFTGSAR